MKTHTYNKENDNPNDTSFTVLQLFCDFIGTQGGTIHQAINEFKDLPIEEQDKFCGILVDNMFNITHLEDVQTFMEIRNRHLSQNKI